MERYLLGLDIGSSSVKAIILCPERKKLKFFRSSIEIISKKPGWAEIDINLIWKKLLLCIDKLLSNSEIKAGQISAIGLSSVCPSLLALDIKGNSLNNPILVNDLRSKKEANFIKKMIDEKTFFLVSGNRIMPGAISLTSMLWILNHRPNIYYDLKCFGHITTWLGYKLCGKFAMDYSNASFTGLFETVERRGWSSDFLKILSIDKSKLPPLAMGGELLGGLINKDLLNRGLRKNIPVSIGGADTACSALALGKIKHMDAFLSLGTSGVLCICTKDPQFDDRFMNRCHVYGSSWLLNGVVSSAGASIKWFIKNFLVNENKKDFKNIEKTYKVLDKMINKSIPGSFGLLFLPYLAGERSPVFDADIRGMIMGLSLKTNKSDILRSIFEGVAYSFKQMFEIAEGMIGRLDYIPVTGGGASTNSLLQIISDVTGKNLNLLDINETSVIGAALLGGLASGIFSNAEEASAVVKISIIKEYSPALKYNELYDSNYGKYKELYARYKDLISY